MVFFDKYIGNKSIKGKNIKDSELTSGNKSITKTDSGLLQGALSTKEGKYALEDLGFQFKDLQRKNLEKVVLQVRKKENLKDI